MNNDLWQALFGSELRGAGNDVRDVQNFMRNIDTQIQQFANQQCTRPHFDGREVNESLKAGVIAWEISYNQQVQINEKLRQEIKDLTDPDRISVDYKQWQDTQRKIKRLGWITRWL